MRTVLIVAMLSACLLSACKKSSDAEAEDTGHSPGRYAGIGTFEPGRLWPHMTVTNAPKDPAAAKIADDEHVVVVVDTHTGEVRQCGDHSGYCVTMNPWTQPANMIPVLPVKLEKHAADLDAEAEAENKKLADQQSSHRWRRAK